MKIWDYIKEKLFNRKKMLPEPNKKNYMKNQNNLGMTGGNIEFESSPEILKKYFDEKENEIFDIKSQNSRIYFRGEKAPNREGVLDEKINNSKIQNFQDNIRVKINVIPNTLDNAIEQYMIALMLQKKSGLEVNPYSVLIQLGAIDNKDSKNNGENEKKFLENARSGKYNKNLLIHEQKNKLGKPIFYHMYTSGKNSKPAKYRVYLNSKKENVALLAHEFAKKFGEEEYYFKFNSNDTESRRSEQFVFYVENEKELFKTASIIESVKREKPKLFEGTEYTNPFLKKCEGYIAYAPEIQKGMYCSLSGQTKNISKSYNTLLSTALEDAFVASGNSLKNSNYNVRTLQEMVDSKLLETIFQDPTLKMKFIKQTKINLELLSKRNSELDIKGIKESIKNQNYGDRQY